MKRAVVAVTLGGLRMAKTIERHCTCDVYALEKHAVDSAVKAIHGSLKDFMKTAFADYDEIIMIMACGIAVRSIAPWLESKLKDPAVVVMDELGKHVISLISGHVGGANRLAEEIAGMVGGRAVITTASDTLGFMAVDTLAEHMDLELQDFEAAKRVTAVMVNGGRVGILSDFDDLSWPDEWIRIKQDDMSHPDVDALIYVGYRKQIKDAKAAVPIVQLIPRRFVLGVGCRKGVDGGKLIGFVEETFRGLDLPVKGIKIIATIALKEREPAVLQLVEHLDAKLEIVEIGEMTACEDQFEKSEFVKSTTGTAGVCQPAAYIASNRGRCILPKTKHEGMTISIYEIMEKAEKIYEG